MQPWFPRPGAGTILRTDRSVHLERSSGVSSITSARSARRGALVIGLRLVVVCCLLWLCACDRAPRAKVIWHLGDSTASQVGPQLDALARARNRGDVVVEIARAPGFTLGRDLGYFVERIRAASPPAEKPDVVLIQLGSNDLRPDGDPSVFALVDTVEELDAAIAGLRRTRSKALLPERPAASPGRHAALAGRAVLRRDPLRG
jgi:hypothetical protein